MALLLHKLMISHEGFVVSASDEQCSIESSHYEFVFARSGCANDFRMSLYFRGNRVVVQCRELGNEGNIRQVGLSVDKYVSSSNNNNGDVERLLQTAERPPMKDLLNWMHTEITTPLLERCFIDPTVVPADKGTSASTASSDQQAGFGLVALGVAAAAVALALIYYVRRSQ